MLRLPLERILAPPKQGGMWSGGDLMLWHPSPHVLGITLPRRVSVDGLLPVASVVERMVRERRAGRALVLDATRVHPDGCDEPTLLAFRRFVVDPLVQHPARVVRALLVAQQGLAQSALVGSVVLAQPAFPWSLFSRVEDALAQLDSSASWAPELVGAVKSELTPVGLISQVRAAIGDTPAAGLHEVAQRLSVAPRTLQRALSAAATTFADERTDVRMELAATRLMRTAQKIDAVAQEVGFASTAHFGVAFKHRFGLSPREFRLRHRGGGP